jgi:hypothetical protein
MTEAMNKRRFAEQGGLDNWHRKTAQLWNLDVIGNYQIKK